MQIGECPYDDCEHVQWRVYEGDTPRVAKDSCESCGRIVWIWFSRIDPDAYTDEEFNERFEIDEEARHIKPR